MPIAVPTAFKGSDFCEKLPGSTNLTNLLSWLGPSAGGKGTLDGTMHLATKSADRSRRPCLPSLDQLRRDGIEALKFHFVSLSEQLAQAR